MQIFLLISIFYFTFEKISCKFNSQTFNLSNWMEQMEDHIFSQTLLDVTLPGTHDSLSYDQSTQVATNSFPQSQTISDLIHDLTYFVPLEFGRIQSMTQFLNITEQLNNGVRFIDFRLHKNDDDWYSFHFMQSKKPAMFYFEEIKAWIEQHQKEIIIIWISHHGGECDVGQDQYPNVSISEKQIFWARIKNNFKDLLFSGNISQTTIAQIIQRNQRVVLYASDYKEFTNNDKYAIDSCKILNYGQPGIYNETNSYQIEIQAYKQAEQIKKSLNGGYMLMRLATSGSTKLVLSQAGMIYGPFKDYAIKECAQSLNITMNWCPMSLRDLGQLANYYKQITLDMAIKNNWDYPNAFYVDGLDYEGTIRTGTRLKQTSQICSIFMSVITTVDEIILNYLKNSLLKCNNLISCESCASNSFCEWCTIDNKCHAYGSIYNVCGMKQVINEANKCGDNHQDEVYGFVDSILFYNMKKFCNQDCEQIIKFLSERRAKFPLKRWDDNMGRSSQWPENSL